jgi:hydroxymethylglutaryl-CoA lyase
MIPLNLRSAPRLVDCPRDAMQGMQRFIPTVEKIDYLNRLMKVGFDIIDFGSFVSPIAIPQLKDTHLVIDKIEKERSNTKLLAIVGNLRGAEQALSYEKIDYLGFPFSISESFLKLNIHSDLEKAFALTCTLLNKCQTTKKQLVIYLSMGFGNPYGDDWSIDLVMNWVNRLVQNGATEINISDTVGISTPERVAEVFSELQNSFPLVNVGFHLHTTLHDWYPRLDAAWNAGCKSFDAVLTGHGGCPLSGHKLVDNLGMKALISYFDGKDIALNIHRDKLDEAFYHSPLL